MEPMKLHFDVRDIFRAPRLALSGKKIWIFLVANFIGYSAYFILNYLAFALAGQSFGETWAAQGLYPCLYVTDAPWYACVLFWVGVIDWVIAIYLGCTAVSRVTYKQLKGDEFYSSRDAWAYVKKHWHPVIFTSVAMALILVFFVSMAALFALFGKLPFLGEFLFALPYLLYLFGAVFTVYTSVVFLVSLIYTPAIVGTIEEDTMGAVFNSYSITWSQPWRVIAYHIVLLPLAALAVGIFKLAAFYGVGLINIVFGHEWLMGEKLTNIVGTAAHTVWPQDLFNSIVAACSTTGSCCAGCSIDAVSALNNFYACFIPTAPASLSGTECVAAVIVGIFFMILTLTFFSYFLSILSVGETIMLTIFRNKSDDDNILERKDEEELEAEEDEGDLDLDEENEEDSETTDDASDTSEESADD